MRACLRVRAATSRRDALPGFMQMCAREWRQGDDVRACSPCFWHAFGGRRMTDPAFASRRAAGSFYSAERRSRASSRWCLVAWYVKQIAEGGVVFLSKRCANRRHGGCAASRPARRPCRAVGAVRSLGRFVVCVLLEYHPHCRCFRDVVRACRFARAQATISTRRSRYVVCSMSYLTCARKKSQARTAVRCVRPRD